MNICLQETEMQYRNQPLGSFWEENCICSYTPLVPHAGLCLHFLAIQREHIPFLNAPRNCSLPLQHRLRITAHFQPFFFWDGLNHFQLPQNLRFLTDGFKALSFMVHYQDLVNRNRLFLPACEDAAECFISGNAAYKYDSALLWHRTSRNCFPLCKLVIVILFWT